MLNKRWVSAGITVLGAIFLLAGCGEKRGQRTNGLDTEEMAGHDGCIVVGYAQVGSESDWRTTNTQSFKNIFTEENGYYLIFEDGQQKQENQVKAIRNFILQDVDYIILDPVVETGWEAVLEEAKEAGIPVILSDRTVEVGDESLYSCWVGSNFCEEGIKAGEWLENYLKEQGREDETIHLVTLQGTSGSSAQIGRSDGFEKILKKHSDWVMLEKQSGDFTQAKGQEVMESFLKQNKDIDVVVAQNDNMAFGAIDALKAAGKTPGKDVTIISFDAIKAALKKVQSGEINAEFECNPLHGPRVAELAKKIMKGEKVDKIQYVDEQVFTKDNTTKEVINKRAY